MSQISEQLSKADVSFRSHWHPPAFSATRRSHYLHRTGKEVAKALLLDSARGPLLAVISSASRLEFPMVEKVMGCSVRMVPSSKVAAILKECECPSIPAFGRWLGLPVVGDRSLLSRPTVVLPTDRICMDVEMSTEAYLRFEQPLVAEIASPFVYKPAPLAVGSSASMAGIR